MKTLLLSLALAGAVTAQAQNPVVQTWFTTDPAPMVHGDRLYLYTGHDEDGADFFWMQEWRVYSTADMVNWTDHGSPLAIEDFSWGDDRAWAPQCIERNGKFYFYVPLHSSLSGGMAIGVAVGNSPTGPFRDVLGKPLYDDGKWDNIDPTVMIDDDGQAWLFWGNPVIKYCQLNEDMISIKGEVMQVNQTEEGFGAPSPELREKGKKYKDMYTEGPWINKYKGKYYLLYAAGGVPEHIAYSWATKPTGPWHYGGTIMPQGGTDSFTNHTGIVDDFKGHSYFFYHTGWLPGGGGFGRSVAVEEYKRNADGSFPTITPTREGVKPIGTLNPYQRVEFETMAFSRGVKTENASKGVYVSQTHNGDYIKLQAVDFGSKGPSRISLSAASALRGGTIELHADSIAGSLIATVRVDGTGGWEKWRTFSAETQPITGTHDLYFVFKGRKGPQLFSLDWWKVK